MKKTLLLLGAVLAIGSNVTFAQTVAPVTVVVTNASGGTSTITGAPADIQALIGLPSGATLPAFNSAGLDFTNVNYKAAVGTEYAASGGTMANVNAEWDFYHGKVLDIGAAANADLSPTGTGLHSAAADIALIKNFTNFQLEGQIGAGGVFEGTRGAYGEVAAEINYNLAKGTGLTFLGGTTSSSVFTYVGGRVSGQYDGKDLKKSVAIYAGVAF